MISVLSIVFEFLQYIEEILFFFDMVIFVFFVSLIALFTQSIYSLKCFIPGECKSVPYYIVESSSMEECVRDCSQSNSICIWSTFDPNKNYCSYFNTICENIDDTLCPMCLTSEKNCTVS